VAVPTRALAYVVARDREGGSYARTVAIKSVRLYRQHRWQLSPRRLLARGALIDRPIFLLGLPGSGATLIGRCLRRNQQVVSMTGCSSYWTGGDEMGVTRDRMRALPRSLWGNRWRADVDRGTFEEWQPFASDELLPFHRRTAADATAEDSARLRRCLRRQIAVYARDRRAARFLDKTHAYTVKVSLIGALLEDAAPFFVLVLRNPYSACPWIARRKPYVARRPLAYEEQLELVAQEWANSCQAVLDDAAGVPQVFAVRFEDFVARPQDTVAALCQQLELDFDRDMVPRPGQALPFATLPTDRKWYPLYEDRPLDRLGSSEVEIVERRCRRLAARFDYSPRASLVRAEPVEPLSLPALASLRS